MTDFTADVVFFTHATARTGFGHAARCARISGLLKRHRPKIVTMMAGDFSADARQWLQAFGGTNGFASTPVAAGVGLYDRMDDLEDPEVIDPACLDLLRAHTRATILFANGHVLPAVSDDVTVIGYKPAPVSSRPPRIYWGLEFAPVAGEAVATTPQPRDAGRILVALGGAQGDGGVRRVFEAVKAVPQIKAVDFLDSPVNPVKPGQDWFRPDQTLAIHRSVPSVAPLIARAGAVIASYGHLAYEAIAAGAPVCVVGQKAFQADYAERLAGRGLCVAGGLISQTGPDQLTGALVRTLQDAPRLSAAGPQAIDGRGLDRIASLILERLDRAS